MRHYWGEAQEWYEEWYKATYDQLYKLKGQHSMTNNNDNKLGFTQVWEGKPTEFISVSRRWAEVQEDHLIVESASYPGNLILWVANEWIDWVHLRLTEEFRAIHKQTTEEQQAEMMYKRACNIGLNVPISPITGLTYAEEESQSCWGDSGIEGRI